MSLSRERDNVEVAEVHSRGRADEAVYRKKSLGQTIVHRLNSDSVTHFSFRFSHERVIRANSIPPNISTCGDSHFASLLGLQNTIILLYQRNYNIITIMFAITFQISRHNTIYEFMKNDIL